MPRTLALGKGKTPVHQTPVSAPIAAHPEELRDSLGQLVVSNGGL